MYATSEKGRHSAPHDDPDGPRSQKLATCSPNWPNTRPSWLLPRGRPNEARHDHHNATTRSTIRANGTRRQRVEPKAPLALAACRCIASR